MPFGERTNWANNVIAAGGATLRWAGREYRVTDPRIVDSAEAMSAFSGIQRALLPRFGIARFLQLTKMPAA
jgi:hypothetical protein